MSMRKVTEEDIKKALLEMATRETEELEKRMQEDTEFEFPPRLELDDRTLNQWYDKGRGGKRRPARRYWPQIAAAVLILFVGINTIWNATAGYHSILHWGEKDKKEYTELQFGIPPKSGVPTELERTDKLGYVPKGYTLESESQDVIGYDAVYRKGTDVINYEQNIYAVNIAVNTETRDTVDTSVNGYPAKLYVPKSGEEDQEYTIIWTTDEYVYMISGSCSQKELRRIAESVNVD